MRIEPRSIRLRLLFLIPILCCTTFFIHIRAYASEGIIRIYADSGTIKREITGESLFDKKLMPGDSKEAELIVENKLDKPIIYDIKCISSENNNLYKALNLSVANSKGEEIYQGNLKNFSVLIGPQKSNKNEKFIMRLSLPRETDNSTAGKSAEFSFVVLLRSEADSKIEKETKAEKDNESSGASSSGSNKGSSNTGYSRTGTGGGGTGRGAVDTYNNIGGDNKISGIRINGKIKESENIIIGSAYERKFAIGKDGSLLISGSKDAASVKISGFITNAPGTNEAVEGGGEFRTYKAIDTSLRKGIDYGGWKKDKDGFWKYIRDDGYYLKNGFALIKDSGAENTNNITDYHWFFFDENGRLIIGWIRAEDDAWYHSHEDADELMGAVESGWIYSSDDKALYYTSEVDAVMKSGWWGFKSEDEKTVEYYFFARLTDTYRQNWFFNTGIGRWLYDRLGYRSYGSMYRAEKTPDGYSVGADGRWIK